MLNTLTNLLNALSLALSIGKYPVAINNVKPQFFTKICLLHKDFKQCLHHLGGL